MMSPRTRGVVVVIRDSFLVQRGICMGMPVNVGIQVRCVMKVAMRPVTVRMIPVNPGNSISPDADKHQPDDGLAVFRDHLHRQVFTEEDEQAPDHQHSDSVPQRPTIHDRLRLSIASGVTAARWSGPVTTCATLAINPVRMTSIKYGLYG